jgi:hypothetical protein
LSSINIGRRTFQVNEAKTVLSARKHPIGRQ